MRPLIWLLALAPVVAFAQDTASWERALERHPLTDPEGRVVRLGELHGDVVVVSFWASWCKPCKKELRALDAWIEESRGSTEAPRILAVSVDSDARKAMRFVQETAVRIPVYHDGPDGLARALDLPALPLTLVLDRDGRIAHVARGGSAEELSALERKVEQLLAEPAAPPAPSVNAKGEEVSG
jgi:peroxiredoxin